MAVIGGDTAVVEGPCAVDVIVAGEVPRGQALRRSGAKPGDQIFVSGHLGILAAQDVAGHNYVDRAGAVDDGCVTSNDGHGKPPGESEQPFEESFQPRSPGACRYGQ